MKESIKCPYCGKIYIEYRQFSPGVDVADVNLKTSDKWIMQVPSGPCCEAMAKHLEDIRPKNRINAITYLDKELND